ncbi:hypothetical protein D2E25_1944 [Bifidobacterium goeldii]|uniref:Cytosolic protein n=1 Tax=Bifidobacterium goeldii TaxID=2306975 RepID=A0A430FDZ5_9BIFI|nr:hypothetical protein [Bifidobacterium goeldii]RSX51008.1 hypothetical protein D2E25_1944 [Bifidobacterium goeldii]
MADFNLGEGLRKVFLAGIGALATGVEKSQEGLEKGQQIIDDLVKKGELTVEQGKALNTELKHKAAAAREAAEAASSEDAKPVVDTTEAKSSAEPAQE